MAHRPPGWISPCSRTTSWRGTCAWSLPTDLATASPHPARTLPRGLAVGRRGPCRPSRRRTFCGSGVSSGAPYAAVCAALVSDRVAGAGLVSGVTDFGWRGAWDGYLEAEATLMQIGDEAQGTEWCEARYRVDDDVSARGLPTGRLARAAAVSGNSRSWSTAPRQCICTTRAAWGVAALMLLVATATRRRALMQSRIAGGPRARALAVTARPTQAELFVETQRRLCRAGAGGTASPVGCRRVDSGRRRRGIELGRELVGRGTGNPAVVRALPVAPVQREPGEVQRQLAADPRDPAEDLERRVASPPEGR